MVAPTLPISRLINVAVNLTPTAAAAQNLSTLLLVGSSDIIDTSERYRTYDGIDAVAADFGTLLPEYLAAVLWFEQVPQPSQLLIGRWAKDDTRAVLRGTPLLSLQQVITRYNAIPDGKFTYALNGGSATTTSPINLVGVTTLSGVAAAITALTPGIRFIYSAAYQRFEATTEASGPNAKLSFLSDPGTGTDLSTLLGMTAEQSGAYTTDGVSGESAIDAATTFDLNYGQQFYGLSMIGADEDDHQAIAQYIEASSNKHIYFMTTQDTGVLVSTTVDDIASIMKSFAYKRTWVQFSSTNPYAAVSAAGRILTTDYNGNNTIISLMYKQEPGIVAENINTAQADVLEGKNCNVFVFYNNNTAIIEKGVVAGGLFLDIITTTDWLSLTIQAALYNLLYASTTKLPQTDAGSMLMVSTIEAVCIQGVDNGMLAPGVWSTNGFGNLAQGDFMPKGYYVFAPKVSTQNLSDRAKRRAVPIQVAAKLAGAVHTIAISINVNQ